MTIEVDIAKGFPVPGVDLGMKVTGSMDSAYLEQARPVPGGKGLVGCRGYPSREPAPDHTVGCSHYAAALRKYWEIPAWRRAIASTSPLSASLSGA